MPESETTMNEQTLSDPSQETNGAGIDRSVLTRPGIPRESEPPQPLASAHWLEPEQQTSPVHPLVGVGQRLTPVFSTAIPLHGLSGLLRRRAYGIADYRARRWLLLMMADRIDVLESHPGKLLKLALGVGLLALGYRTLTRFARA